jgi:hypothetical protein
MRRNGELEATANWSVQRTVSTLYFHRGDWKNIIQIKLPILNIFQYYFHKISGFI